MKSHTLTHPEHPHVPWPYELQFREPSKNPEIRKVEWDEAYVLYEQDVWRARIETLKALSLRKDAFSTFQTHKFEDIAAKMKEAGASYPPTGQQYIVHSERQSKEFFHEGEYTKRKLQAVADEGLRRALYFYDQCYRQLQRIKAVATFCALFKVDPDSEETNLIFRMWSIEDSLRIIEEEEEKLRSMSAVSTRKRL